MIDLTNKNVEVLIQKYAPVLELIRNREQIPILAYLIDYGVQYIQFKYKFLDIDWKCWAIILIRNQQIQKKINTEKDIDDLIDNFVKYYQESYREYINDLGTSTCDYDRDREFVYRFLSK